MKTILYLYDGLVRPGGVVPGEIWESLTDENIEFSVSVYPYNKIIAWYVDSSIKDLWKIIIIEKKHIESVSGMDINAVFGIPFNEAMRLQKRIFSYSDIEAHGKYCFDMINYINKIENEYNDCEKTVNSLEPQPFFQPKIEKVIFNKPATIVFWDDETKTIVKCSNEDTYSKETGLAMCICKKIYGNDNTFRKVFSKWIPEEDERIFGIHELSESLAKVSKSVGISVHKPLAKVIEKSVDENGLKQTAKPL